VVTGPREVGKTTLARQVVDPHEANHFDLEDPRDEARLGEPTLTSSGLAGTVVLDDAQRRDDIFPILRVLVDEDHRNGRFLVLVLGSASPELVGLASERLAGRVALVELTEFQLTDALVIRQLQPWHADVGKRQVRSPKVYVRDSGLPHRLLGIDDQVALLSRPKMGASWEGFVIEVKRTDAPRMTPSIRNALHDVDLA
jgi:predicted AAA+ superfamily ATPase